MRYMKTFCLAALMLAVFGIAAASASAVETQNLPTLLLLPGVNAVNLEGANATAKTKFTGIQNLAGVGWLFKLEGTNMASLGTAKLLFTKVVLGAKKCKTLGDAAETVLIDNAEWHLVLGLGTDTTLFLLLTLLPAAGVKIECEGVNIIVKGHQLTDVKPFGVEVGLPANPVFEGSTGACTGSVPAFKEYDLMTSPVTMATAELKSEVGGISAKSCEEIEGSINLKPTQDVEVMEP
jgi:hypothetical protein